MENLDYKLIKESFSVKEDLVSGQYNQSVELDLALPDYRPEVFRVLSLCLEPTVQSYSVSPSRLSYDLNVKIRLVYLTEDGELSSLEQNLIYPKSIELPYSVKNPCVSLKPYVDTQSVRVVNKRRIDVRGIIGINASVSANASKQAVSDASGAGLQLKKELISYPSKRICVSKQITVIDEVDLTSQSPDFKSLVWSSGVIKSCDRKILSGKVLIKGEAEIRALYSENSGEIKTVRFTLPFSQLCDVEGVNESYDVYVSACVTDTDLRALTKTSDTILECEVGLNISLVAMRFESALLGSDAYSTDYDVTIGFNEASVETIPTEVSKSFKSKVNLGYSDGEIRSVIFCDGGIKSFDVKEENGYAVISGNALAFSYFEDDSSRLVYLESVLPFEEKIKLSGELSANNICISVQSAAFNIISSNALEVMLDVSISGYVFSTAKLRYIEKIDLGYREDKGDGTVTLKLYFARSGDSIWEIAKLLGADYEKTLEENELSSDVLESNKTIIIPILK